MKSYTYGRTTEREESLTSPRASKWSSRPQPMRLDKPWLAHPPVSRVKGPKTALAESRGWEKLLGPLEKSPLGRIFARSKSGWGGTWKQGRLLYYFYGMRIRTAGGNEVEVEPDVILRAAATIYQARRRSRAGGRPLKPFTCRWCHREVFGRVTLVDHERVCDQRRDLEPWTDADCVEVTAASRCCPD
jgi:hypothetical protein